jgi:hypothetical protein
MPGWMFFGWVALMFAVSTLAASVLNGAIGSTWKWASGRVVSWRRYMDDGYSRTLNAAELFGVDLPAEMYDALYESDPGARPPWPLYPLWNGCRNRRFAKRPMGIDELEAWRDLVVEVSAA